MIFSPLTIRRFQSFRRIRRAWYALIGFCVVFVFCLAADFVCPCDPQAVVDPATLAGRETTRIVRLAERQTARFNLLPDGRIVDFEGPAELLAQLRTGVRPEDLPYEVQRTPHAEWTRVFMRARGEPVVTEHVEPLPPVTFPFPPCAGHPFGLDAGGRDVYARVVHGLRIALLFGLLLAASGMFFGLVIGAIEGYFGGKTDILLQRLTEIWSAVPFLYVMIFIGSTVGRSFMVLLVCYAIFNWITVSYYLRAEFLRLRSATYVEAAKTQGFSTARVIFGHILPNALTPLITLAPFLLVGAIGSLAALDFLGFGLPPLTPSCGELLQEAQQFRSAWWLVLFPSVALFLVMLLTVLVGEGLREAFDPRHKSKLE